MYSGFPPPALLPPSSFLTQWPLSCRVPAQGRALSAATQIMVHTPSLGAGAEPGPSCFTGCLLGQPRLTSPPGQLFPGQGSPPGPRSDLKSQPAWEG